MIQGVIFSCQFLVCTVDEPTLACDILKASGFTKSELIKEQKLTGYENLKMISTINDAFRKII